jgi:CrcB protein
VIVGLFVVLFAVAAALGACCRMLATESLNSQFPYGTLAVNVGASLALGAMSQLGQHWQTVIGVGALGAFSTWSTVANEVARLARDGQGTLAALYLGLSTTTGVLAAWVGIQLAGL